MHTYNATVLLDLDAQLDPYLNLNMELAAVQPYLDFLKTQVDSATYLIYTVQQQLRDSERHHVTVVTPIEYPKLPAQATVPFNAYPVQVSLLGVGHIAEGDNEVYFIVCESPAVQAIRAALGLASADLHITLGFKQQDIFDQPKNRSTLLFPYSVVENSTAK